MSKVSLTFSLVGQDQLSAVIDRAQKKAEEFAKGSGAASRESARAFGQLRGSIEGIPGRLADVKAGVDLVAKGLGAARKVASELFSSLESGEQARNVETIFRATVKNAEQTLQSLRAATRETVDDTSLQAMATRLQGIGIAATDMGSLTAAAFTAATATMQDGKQAADAFADAVAKGRAQSLTAYGVTVDLKGAVESYAEAQGRTVSQLSQAELVQARLNAVLAETTNQFRDIPFDQVTNDTGKLRAQWANLVSDLETRLTRQVIEFADALGLVKQSSREFATDTARDVAKSAMLLARSPTARELDDFADKLKLNQRETDELRSRVTKFRDDLSAPITNPDIIAIPEKARGWEQVRRLELIKTEKARRLANAETQITIALEAAAAAAAARVANEMQRETDAIEQTRLARVAFAEELRAAEKDTREATQALAEARRAQAEQSKRWADAAKRRRDDEQKLARAHADALDDLEAARLAKDDDIGRARLDRAREFAQIEQALKEKSITVATAAVRRETALLREQQVIEEQAAKAREETLRQGFERAALIDQVAIARLRATGQTREAEAEQHSARLQEIQRRFLSGRQTDHDKEIRDGELVLVELELQQRRREEIEEARERMEARRREAFAAGVEALRGVGMSSREALGEMTAAIQQAATEAERLGVAFDRSAWEQRAEGLRLFGAAAESVTYVSANMETLNRIVSDFQANAGDVGGLISGFGKVAAAFGASVKEQAAIKAAFESASAIAAAATLNIPAAVAHGAAAVAFGVIAGMSSKPSRSAGQATTGRGAMRGGSGSASAGGGGNGLVVVNNYYGPSIGSTIEGARQLAGLQTLATGSGLADRYGRV